jgi:hemoglobin-like flavoprotein
VRETYKQLRAPKKRVFHTFMTKLTAVEASNTFSFTVISRQQQATLLTALKKIVANLHDDDGLQATLAAIIVEPSDADILHLYYAPVGNAMLATLEEVLGKACTSDTLYAWLDEYRRVVNMLEDLIATPRHDAC